MSTAIQKCYLCEKHISVPHGHSVGFFSAHDDGRHPTHIACAVNYLRSFSLSKNIDAITCPCRHKASTMALRTAAFHLLYQERATKDSPGAFVSKHPLLNGRYAVEGDETFVKETHNGIARTNKLALLIIDYWDQKHPNAKAQWAASDNKFACQEMRPSVVVKIRSGAKKSNSAYETGPLIKHFF